VILDPHQPGLVNPQSFTTLANLLLGLVVLVNPQSLATLADLTNSLA
jgi:hypothetical protein